MSTTKGCWIAGNNFFRWHLQKIKMFQHQTYNKSYSFCEKQTSASHRSTNSLTSDFVGSENLFNRGQQNLSSKMVLIWLNQRSTYSLTSEFVSSEKLFRSRVTNSLTSKMVTWLNQRSTKSLTSKLCPPKRLCNSGQQILYPQKCDMWGNW